MPQSDDGGLALYLPFPQGGACLSLDLQDWQGAEGSRHVCTQERAQVPFVPGDRALPPSGMREPRHWCRWFPLCACKPAWVASRPGEALVIGNESGRARRRWRC